MSKKKITSVAVACLLVGVFTGVAAAQVFHVLQRRYLNTGLFSVTADQTVSFHVTLDDEPGEPPARVLLQLFDESGTVAAQEEVTLLAGQSATLQSQGPGSFRAHAEVVDSGRQLTGRRTTVGTVELFDVNDESTQRRFVCSIVDDGKRGGGIPQG